MNLDEDIECTCDVGPFATCPACEANRSFQSVGRVTRTVETPKPSLHIVDLVLHYQKLAKK